MARFRIVETDNFGGDYPNESFLNLLFFNEDHANRTVEAINAGCSGEQAPRYWKVVPDGYVLQPGFEP